MIVSLYIKKNPPSVTGWIFLVLRNISYKLCHCEEERRSNLLGSINYSQYKREEIATLRSQ